MSGCIKEGKKKLPRKIHELHLYKGNHNQYLPKLTTSCFDHAGKVTRKEIIKM